MTVQTTTPKPRLETRALCCSCQRALASVVQICQDGELFQTCSSCYIPIVGAEVKPCTTSNSVAISPS